MLSFIFGLFLCAPATAATLPCWVVASGCSINGEVRSPLCFVIGSRVQRANQGWNRILCASLGIENTHVWCLRSFFLGPADPCLLCRNGAEGVKAAEKWWVGSQKGIRQKKG